jgi:polyisoprenoid-binding protein YceI
MNRIAAVLMTGAALLAPSMIVAQPGTAAVAEAAAEVAPDVFGVKEAHAAKGTVFFVNDARGRDTISFTSRAPLEDIVGTTSRITGYIAFDPANPTAGGAGRFTVPVATLSTGIPMRDEHLRGADWLDAETHPEIVLEIDNVTNVTTSQTGEGFTTYDGTLVGSFTLKGVTKPVQIPAKVTYMKQSERTQSRLPGNLLGGRASFTVALADHGVSQGSIGTKVGETITVDVSFVASDVKPEARPERRRPAGGEARPAGEGRRGNSQRPSGEPRPQQPN